MRAGDLVRLTPSGYVPPGKNARGDGFSGCMRLPDRAVVVYVHPEGRFYTVRFEYQFGSFCESFFDRKRGTS